QVPNNDQATLERLASPGFDPTQEVLVSGLSAPPPESKSTNAEIGSVEITDYKSKRVQLSAKAEVPTVLLLNDKYDPDWRVRVDGQPAPLLRCNFLMRGVHLTPGTHTV